MLGIGAPIKGTPAWHQARSRGCADMSLDEERTLFANWAIVSSPLVLAIDTTDDDVVAKYWPIVANPTALHINAAWHGEAGRLLLESDRTFNVDAPVGAACEASARLDLPLWTVYTKKISQDSVAVLPINLSNKTLTFLSLTVEDLNRALTITSLGISEASADPVQQFTSFQSKDVWTGADGPQVTAQKPWNVTVSAKNSTFLVFVGH